MRDLTRKAGYTWGGGFRIFKPQPDSLNAKVKRLLKRGDVEMARNLLTPLLRSGIMRLTDMGNMLIELFGKHGCLDEAKLVFDKIHRPNNSTWYFLLQAYALHGRVVQAKWVYDSMPSPNLLFSVCHNLLLGLYVSKGQTANALVLFRSVPQPSTVSWKIMFSGLVEHGQLDQAQALLLHESSRLPRRSDLAWVAVVNTYIYHGHLVQAMEAFNSMPEKPPSAYSAVIIGLARSGYLQHAQGLFDEAPDLDEDAWNLMITAYAQKGHTAQARELFLASPHRPNQVTCIAMMFSFGREGDVKAAQKLYDRIQVRSVVVQNAMLTALAQNRRLKEAREIFRVTQDRNLVTWTNMIQGYVLRNATIKSKNLFDEMPYESVVASNAMASMYAKRGLVEDAKKLYEKLRNELTSMVMLLGNARLKNKDGFRYFGLMNLEGQRPDEFTWTCLLAACRELGCVEQARDFFQSMVIDFGLQSRMEHYVGMVEVLGHNGKLDEAEELAKNMPFIDEVLPTVQAALVASAKANNDHDRARRLTERVKKKLRHLTERDEPLVTPKLLLESIMATSYLQDEVVIRQRMQGAPRLLDYLSIPVDAQAEPVLVTPFA